MTATKDQIEEFINLFDDNTTAAIEAIKSAEKVTVPPRVNLTTSQNSGDEVLSLSNVQKSYVKNGNKIEILKSIDLKVHAGEIIAITGESGSGKSTLLHILGCLDRPSAGDIFANGVNIANVSDARLSEIRGELIGFVFQSFYLQPFLRIRDNIAVPAMFKGADMQSIDARVDELLKDVGLFEKSTYYPKELSGGQMQRVAIARALMNGPKVILADEPTGNLDSQNSDTVISLFNELRDRTGAAVVIVTHSKDIASRSDRVINLKDGLIV